MTDDKKEAVKATQSFLKQLSDDKSVVGKFSEADKRHLQRLAKMDAGA